MASSGRLVGVGDGDGALGFGAALLASAAGVGGVDGLAGGTSGGFLALVFVFGKPVVFPAETVEKLFEKAAGVNMFRRPHAGDEAVDVALAAGGKFVGGFESLAAGTATRDDKAGINYGANERNAFFDGLAVLLFRVESEVEFALEELLDGVDVAEELFALFGGDDNEEVVDVTAVMFIAEIEGDVAVELVEEDVREKLAGEVANDDAAAFGLIEETFADRQFAPVGAGTADNDVFHGVVVDDLMPEKFDDLVELVAVASVTTNAVLVIIFFVVERDMGNGVGVVFKLAVEAPANTLVEFAVVEAHEVALDVELDDESGAGVIFCGATDVGGEALLAEKGAFADTTGVGIDDEAAIPPVGANIIKEVMNDAVAERGGDDFADDGIVDDESDAAARFVATLDDAVAKKNEVFHVVQLEAMLVDGFALAFASAIVGMPKFAEEKIFETGVVESGELGIRVVVRVVEVGGTIGILIEH